MILLILLWSALVQTPVQTASPPVRIQGKVLDAATGNPLAGATVRIPAIFGTATVLGPPPVVRPQVRTESATDGTFTLELPESGPHDVFVSRAGYKPWKTTLSDEEERRQVPVVFRLVPEAPVGVVAGRAIDAGGRPLVGAKVQLLGYSRMSQISLGAYSDHPVFSEAASRDTNDRGEYRIIDVKPGKYFLRVPPPPSSELSPLGAAFYPGFAGLTKAKSFEVHAGEEVRLEDIVLTPTTLGPIRVRTIDATGENAANANPLLSLFGGPAPDNPPATVGSVGGVPAIRPDEPGNYEVCAMMTYLVQTPIRMAHGRNACTDVVYTGDALEITLTIQRAVGRFTGRVLFEPEDGTGTTIPLAGAGIGGVGVGYGTNYGGTSDTSGYFQSLFPLPDGPVKLRFLDPPEGYYVASIRQGSRDALEEGVLVAGEDTNLDVRVRKGVGILNGTIFGSDGKPPDHAAVVLIPEGPMARRPDKDNTHRTATTNLNGRFEIRNIIPGRYRAYAFATIEDGAHLDAEVFKPFEERSTLIEITKDSRISVDLRIADSGTGPN